MGGLVMAIRSILLPAVTLALPFLVNACGNEPTSASMRTRGPEASVLGPGPAPLKLKPVAGNFPPAAGWTSMSANSAAPDFCYSSAAPTICTLTAASMVVQRSVLVDEMGTWYIDRVMAAGNTTGERNGS
jgi:hypothetical protein